MHRLFALFLHPLALFAADPFEGTWRLNFVKSKLQFLSTVMETETVSKTGPNTYLTITDRVDKLGRKSHEEISRIWDGREHFISGTGINPGAGQRTEINTLIDTSTLRRTQKRNGQITGELTLTVSGGGSVMTIHRTYRTEQIYVFDKQ